MRVPCSSTCKPDGWRRVVACDRSARHRGSHTALVNGYSVQWSDGVVVAIPVTKP